MNEWYPSHKPRWMNGIRATSRDEWMVSETQAEMNEWMVSEIQGRILFFQFGWIFFLLDLFARFCIYNLYNTLWGHRWPIYPSWNCLFHTIAHFQSASGKIYFFIVFHPGVLVAGAQHVHPGDWAPRGLCLHCFLRVRHASTPAPQFVI